MDVKVTEKNFEQYLRDLLSEADPFRWGDHRDELEEQGYFEDEEDFDPEAEVEVTETHSFDDVGMLTLNKGVVVRMSDGTEFQLTVVQSKSGRGGW